MELHSVNNQADQHKTQTGQALTYEQYSNLLLSAASAYDATHTPKEAPSLCPKGWAVYTHDIVDTDFYDALETDTTSDITYDIDAYVDTIQAHAHHHWASPQSPPLDQQIQCLPECPRISGSSWHLMHAKFGIS